MASLFANVGWSGLGIGATVGAAALYVLAKVSRDALHRMSPSFIPGQPNTVLLATARPKSSKDVSAKDLEDAKEYDYIIIGTGTAGCVLANRLTVDSGNTVLAIESGHSDLKQVFSRIPMTAGMLWNNSEAAQQYYTEREAECNDRKLFWPRGKMLGGSSALNGQIYNKGAPSDFDEWASLGNVGWAYNDVFQYMKRAECFFEPTALPPKDLAEHGRSGPWQIGYTTIHPLTKMFINACEAVGIQKVDDLNTQRGTVGVSPFQTFIDAKGQRSSTAVAYLSQAVAGRSNLNIATGQTVTKIIVDDTSNPPRAVGVEMAASGISPIRYLAKAKKEVILCAGALQSPQVLKLSGIGPPAELQKFGIPVVKALKAVGTNLADHLICTTCFESKLPSLQYLLDPMKSIGPLIEWFRFGTGAVSSNIVESGCFVRIADRADAPESLKKQDLTSGPGSADLEIMIQPLAYLEHGKQVPSVKKDWFSMGAIALRPSSRGSITLASSDPFEAPVIHANYLTTQNDRDVMTYGMRLIREIGRSSPFESAFRAWYHPSDKFETMSDAELLNAVRDHSETVYHPMCSNPMGQDEATSVVDEKLRVHGVQGLRVVDASIFPTPVACHPCAPVVMVAEKAADLIISDSAETWKLEEHDDCVGAVTFSPDGQVISSASHDKIVRLWNAATSEMIQLIPDVNTIFAIAFSADRKSLQTNAGVFLLERNVSGSLADTSARTTSLELRNDIVRKCAS